VLQFNFIDPETTKKICIPVSEFGKSVRETGFSRVCPKCWKKWSSREIWTQETSAVGPQIRRHTCGGEMLVPGTDSELFKL
jgi:hypothetical protein